MRDTHPQVRSTFRSGHTRPLSWRRSQLQAVIRLVEENRAPLEAALAKDLGVNKFWYSVHNTTQQAVHIWPMPLIALPPAYMLCLQGAPH